MTYCFLFYYLFEPEERIGLSASFLPRKRSTTELLRHHFNKLFFFNPAINLSHGQKIPTQTPQRRLLLCGQGGIWSQLKFSYENLVATPPHCFARQLLAQHHSGMQILTEVNQFTSSTSKNYKTISKNTVL